MTKPTGEKRPKARNATASRRYLSLIILIFFCLAAGYGLVSCSKTPETAENKGIEPAPAPSEKPLVEIDPNADFSRFKHSNPQHERLPCALCHQRQDNSAKPNFPGHLPCSGCHTQQFADNRSAICTICHTEAESSDLKGFPALQSFGAKFDHAVHSRQANCADCHRPIRRGEALSIPSRTTAHATCFQCHKPDAEFEGKKIDSCETCHQAGNPPPAVSDRSPAFARSFSHAKHKLNCAACHTVRAQGGRGRQVGAPVAAMHFPPKGRQSCASCHNNRRVFGGDDFSDCRRCHQGNNFRFR
ncbi:MAG: cytochrome c3 family protein [Pyrinomonadaceae bacterium]